MKKNWSKEALSDIANVVISIDKEMKITAVNEACRKWGYDNKKMVGLSFFKILAPQDIGRVSEQFNSRSSSCDESWSADTRVLTVEGQELEVLWTIGVADKEGIRYLTATDISMFKSDYQKIQASEFRLRTLINNVSAGLVIMNKSGLIESLNPTAEKMFDELAEKLAGRHISCLFDESADAGEKSPEWQKIAEQLLLLEQFQTTMIRCRKKTGESFDAVLGISNISTYAGDLYLLTLLQTQLTTTV
ncbi:PAS domain S-box protein [bacterium]|nr:PAS domain S-box protein [bacterium]